MDAALSYFQAYVEAMATDVRVKNVVKDVWRPPREGMFKLNCDAGWVRDGATGFSAVITDHFGDVEVAAVHQEEGGWDAEAMAVRF